MNAAPNNAYRKLFRAIAIIAAILGGAFIGLFSCGAYSWQKPLVLCVVATITLIAILPQIFARPFAFWRGMILIAVIIVSYLLSEAVAAAFYPTTPDSFSDFWHVFVQTLKDGPC